MASIATLRDICDALTKAGLESGNLETITSDLKIFFSLLSKNEELRNILTTTAFEVDERKNIISDVSNKLGLIKETRNFLMLACELGKFGTMLNKKDSIMRKLDRAAGKLKAEIISARVLTENELSRIRESLSKTTGKDVEVNINIDASIIGGLITKIENKVCDSSIKTRLEKLQSALTL